MGRGRIRAQAASPAAEQEMEQTEDVPVPSVLPEPGRNSSSDPPQSSRVALCISGEAAHPLPGSAA